VGARPGPRPAGPPPTTGRPPPQPAAPCRTGAPTTPPSSTAASAPAATPLRSVRADPVQPGQHVLPQQLRARQRDQQLPTGQATATALDRPDPGIQRRPPPAGPPARTPPASPPPASTTDPTRRPEPVDATHLHQVFCSPNGCLPTTRTGCLRQLQFSGETGTLFTSPRRHALPPISLTADLSQRARSPASLRRRSAHRRSRICLMSALSCGAGALAVWIGLGLGVGRRLGRHSPMKSPPGCRSRRRTRCHVDGGLSALVAVRLPGGHRVVLVMQPDQPRREPPLDYPTERRSTAPAIRVAATLAIERVMDVLQEAACHALSVVRPMADQRRQQPEATTGGKTDPPVVNQPRDWKPQTPRL